MSQPIAINGTRLDEVRMPMVPFDSRTLSFLSYPTSEFHISRSEGKLALIVPAYVGVELYRIGILPQDANIPVEVSIAGRSVGRYVVSDIRYPSRTTSPWEQIIFTFTSVLQGAVRDAATAPPPLRSGAATKGMFVADITHYLDESGEMATLPTPARKLASFLTLLINAATGAFPERDRDSGVRCRKKGCKGSIRTLLPTSEDAVSWQCPACGYQGIISNWQKTKWNRLKHYVRPE
jgi:predicted RNA-binding Zn-ribbon protein involved in translation (DUF1610 family)